MQFCSSQISMLQINGIPWSVVLHSGLICFVEYNRHCSPIFLLLKSNSGSMRKLHVFASLKLDKYITCSDQENDSEVTGLTSELMCRKACVRFSLISLWSCQKQMALVRLQLHKKPEPLSTGSLSAYHTSDFTANS